MTVIFTLLYLPFGKFFHIFQRPAQLGIDFYQRAGEEGGQARVRALRTAVRVAAADRRPEGRSRARLAFDIEMPDGTHYQDVCPPCRRKNLALTQDALWRDSGASCSGSNGFDLWQNSPLISRNLVEQFGPHLNRVPAGGWVRVGEADRMVKTHCCFCGQQCGIQLKVQGQQGRRLRAVGGLSLQPGQALPQGREALHAGRAPGSAQAPLAARRGQRLRADRLGRRARAARSREIQRIQADVRQRCLRAC